MKKKVEIKNTVKGGKARDINKARILLVSPGHGISTIDVFLGAGDALKLLGQDVYSFKLRNRIKFYQDAMGHFVKGTNQRVSISEVYNIACQGLFTSVFQTWPDLILFITGQYIPPWVPSLIRERAPHIKQAVWYTESPYMLAYEVQRAPVFDYVFTCDKLCAEVYKKFCPESHYLPTAYNSNYEWETEMRRWESIIYAPDLFFVGSEVPGRLDFLKELAQHIKGKVQFKLFGVFPSIEKGLCPELEPFYIPMTLTKFEVIKYYNNAKIILNHSRISESKRMLRNLKTGEMVEKKLEPYSLGPRVYEIMAAGGFLLTDYRPELDDLFEVGKDLVVYKNAKDCADKVLEYLDKEKERKAIAQRGKSKVKEHTYINRMQKMLSIVQ